jgi:phytoene synthase
VAGVVGLLCARIFGQREPDTSEYAVRLGVGFQLVNILRDLRQDGRRGRLYLPLEDLRRFGCDEEALLGPGPPGPGFDPFIRFEAARARDILRQARSRLPAADRRAMWPAEAMAAVYESLLGRIEAQPRRILDETVSMPRWRKAALVIGARLRPF